MTPQTLVLAGGRTLDVFDTAPDDDGSLLAVYWHHGSPNVGAPPAPLFGPGAELGVRWISHSRPGYAGSARVPERRIADVADDVARVADHLGVERFATMGHSAGGAHALATAALLPDRVVAVAALAGMAPLDAVTASGGDWWAGLGPGGSAELRAATGGREALEQHLRTSQDEPDFTAADEAALAAEWAWFLTVVRPALVAGMDGFVDDDLAAVRAWGLDPADVIAPTLLVHGEADAVVPCGHAAWNAERVPGAELWLRPGEGHVSIMRHAADALTWVVDPTRAGPR